MTEPKVVDQWIDESRLEYRVFSNGVHDFRAPGEQWISSYMKDGVHGFRDLFSHRIARFAARVQELEEKSRIDDEQGDLMAEECARLAARVRELEEIATVNLSDYTDLVAKKARLAARVQELEGHAELYRELAARVDDDEDSLVAENTRLRKALDRITEIAELMRALVARSPVSAKDSGYVDYARWNMMLTEARQALKEKP